MGITANLCDSTLSTYSRNPLSATYRRATRPATLTLSDGNRFERQEVGATIFRKGSGRPESALKIRSTSANFEKS